MTLNKNWQKEWDQIEVPHEKISQLISEAVEEMPEETKKKRQLNFKSPVMTFIYGAAVAAIISIAVSTGMNPVEIENYATSEGAIAKREANSEVTVGAGEEAKVTFDEEESSRVDDGTRIITEYQLSKESYELKKDYEKIMDLVKKHDGVTAYSDVNLTQVDGMNPSAYLTMNIPTEKVNGFLEELEKIGKTLNSSTNQSDVSTEYFDNESRIKALETEEKALLDLLEKSDKVEDMITIQERLSSVRSEREDLVRDNQSFDKRIDYTTVNLYMDEVATTKPQKSDNFWERVTLNWKNQQINLKQFGENLLVFFLSYGIYLIVVVILVGGVIWKIKK